MNQETKEEVKHEQCRRCHTWRTLDLFLNDKNRKVKTCLKCRDTSKKDREKNKCEHNRQKSKCKECGGGSICEHNRQKYGCKECQGKGICEHNIYRSTCKKCNCLGHLSMIVNRRISKSLTFNKDKHYIEYLGCSIEEFKEHIELQFQEGMNWENYGEWHIDHIIPLKYENPTLEETIERLHWINTQPLWAVDNFTKGNRFVG